MNNGVSMSLTGSEDRDLLAKDKVLKGQLSLGAQRRSQRSNEDPQPLEHAPKASRTPQKKAIESSRTNKREGQGRKNFVRVPLTLTN